MDKAHRQTNGQGKKEAQTQAVRGQAHPRRRGTARGPGPPPPWPCLPRRAHAAATHDQGNGRDVRHVPTHRGRHSTRGPGQLQKTGSPTRSLRRPWGTPCLTGGARETGRHESCCCTVTTTGCTPKISARPCLVSKKFCKTNTLALSFVFNKYYPIMD